MAAGTIDTGTALYYPYIHPRRIDEVKAGLVYWDRIRRIVPDAIRTGTHAVGDDDDARLLADEGLLVATDPHTYEDDAANVFLRHLEGHEDTFRLDIDTAQRLAASNRGFHVEKMSEPVRERLREEKIGYEFGDWIAIHDEVGAFYMFCLAGAMGRRMRASLLIGTDDEEQDDEVAIGKAVLFERTTDSDAVSDVLVKVGITLPSPADLAGVSAASMAQFVTRRAAERQRFRAAVKDVVDVIRTADDPLFAEDYAATKAVEIAAATKDLRDALDEVGVGAFNGIANLSVPAGAAAAIASLSFSPVAAAILAATGIAIGAIACYAETRGKLREARTDSPYHYLVRLERELNLPPTTV